MGVNLATLPSLDEAVDRGWWLEAGGEAHLEPWQSRPSLKHLDLKGLYYG